jgi:hypothetical protein
VAANPVRAEAEVAQRLEVSELYRLARERLGDDRPGHVARVLARTVVVEHAGDDAGDAEGVVVVHGQEVGGYLRCGVDRLRVDRRALVQDQTTRLVEVVLVRDVLVHVPVLLGRSGRVELLELELPVDDRLQEVQRAENVGGDRLVGPVPRLAHVGLRAEVEHVRPVGRVLELADEVVDRGAVGQVGEVNLEAVAEVADVVERAARVGADEGVDRRAQLDQGVCEMRTHEPVRPGDENGASLVDVAELTPDVVERAACPESVVRHGAYASASVSKRR